MSERDLKGFSVLSQRLGIVADKAAEPSILHQSEMLGKKEIAASSAQNHCLPFLYLTPGLWFPCRRSIPPSPGSRDREKVGVILLEGVFFLLGRSSTCSHLQMVGGQAHADCTPCKSPRHAFSRTICSGGCRFRGWWLLPSRMPQSGEPCVFQHLLFDIISFVHLLVAESRVEELLLVQIPVKN